MDDPKLHYEHPDVVTWQMLPGWLLERVPEIRPDYEDALTWASVYDGVLHAYAMFAFALKPRIEQLLEASDESELKRIFDLLEYLTLNGDASVQNELAVMMEELDLWRVWQFLGSTMQRQEFEGLIWYPVHPEWVPPENIHVERDAYETRWREEIEKIGGVENLTAAWILYIRHVLVEEFDIVGLPAPKPGGTDWLAAGMPWPIPRQ